MSVGALKTLVTSLQASSFLGGVSVAFGEEMIAAQEMPLPFVVIVPKGGPWEEPGYIAGLDPSVENVWSTREEADIYMWAYSSATNAQPVDHADAVETLRQQVLSALQDQRNQANTDGSNAPGLYWKPTDGHWELMQNALSRYGRGYVLSVMTEIAVPCLPQLTNIATVTSETVNSQLTGSQHVA